jgi:3-methyladenine DNA glycosylase AlkD
MVLSADIFCKKLFKFRNSAKAQILLRFFKTGPGEYGEGDVFLGITVSETRKIAKEFKDISFKELQKILNSSWHEVRLGGLLILVMKYNEAKKDTKEEDKIIKFYIKNIKNINNWDLVDLSCPYILGPYFFSRDRKFLYELSRDKNMWAHRLSIISTFYFIKNKDLDDTYKIATILLNNKEDLMHKAVGWMLREAGKRDKGRLEKFLIKNKKNIHRTTWRYAIEKFPEKQRQEFLKIK